MLDQDNHIFLVCQPVLAFPSRLEIPGIPGTGILTQYRDFRAGNPGTEVYCSTSSEGPSLQCGNLFPKRLWQRFSAKQFELGKIYFLLFFRPSKTALNPAFIFTVTSTSLAKQPPNEPSYKSFLPKYVKGEQWDGHALHVSHYYKTHTYMHIASPPAYFL